MTSERSLRLVAFLFTDIVGSTKLTQTLGDEVAQDVLREHNRILREQVASHHGTEVKAIGDGFMTTFDNVQDGIRCAVDIQHAIDQYNRAHPQQPVLVRIGLNAGEAIQEEADYFGSAVIAAARITAKAEGGQVLVSNVVRELAAAVPDLRFLDRGRFRLKGFPERWRLFEVVWREDTAAMPALLERTPFVGRDTERTELRRLLDQVARSQGGLVMIGGEPGVGKTRLAEELMAEARQRGLLTLTGHCYEMEGAPPYIPFVEIVEASSRLVPPEALRSALGESAPEVAKLMPELRRLFPDIPDSPELPPEQERRYLFNGMRDFLARAGHVQPMFLLLDDLHWADDSTMLLLQHIVQQLAEMPVLFVGTYRDVELDVARPLARALEELLRQRLAHDITLRRLPEGGVSAMLRALSGQEPPAPLVDIVYSETEGNPFFVEEVFQHLAEEGKLFDAEGRWRSDLQVSELEVPRGVRLVIGRRLERVGEECRRVLTSAAVIGRAFTFELLEALGDVDTDALLDAVDEAERANLIASAEDGPEARFKFAHELIRQTLVSSLSLPRRQRMHLRVADAMERAYAPAPEEHASDLAHHLHQAGAAADPEKAVRYLTLAGEQALGAAAFEDALRYYDDALSLLPTDDQGGRAALLYNRGRALRSLGRWEEALTAWQESLAEYEKLGDVEAVGRVCWDISEQFIWVARNEDALEIASRGLGAVGERVSASRCRLLSAAAQAQAFVGDYRSATRMIGEALAIAEDLADPDLLGLAIQYKGVIHWSYGQVRELLGVGRQGEESRRSAGDLWLLADALWITQWALWSLGSMDEAAEIGEELEPLATRLGHLGALLLASRNRGWRDFMLTADINAFEEFARGDLERGGSFDFPWISNSHTWLGLAHFWRGQWQKALEHFQEAVKLEPPGFFAGADWAFLFLSKSYSGDNDTAIAMLGEKRGDLPLSGQPSFMGSQTMLLAAVEGLAVLDERGEAAQLYPQVLEAMDTGALLRHLDIGLLQTVAGIAAAAGGRWDKAEEHYQAALRLAHDLSVVIAQPEVRRWYARMLIDRDAPGDRDKARELLTEAITMYRQIGMPKHVEMAEALLREA